MADAPRDDALQLVVGGRAWQGWQSVRVHRGIEHAAGGFELGVSELWHGQDRPAAARAGDRCEVRIGGETVITGWVDGVELGMDARQHEATIFGRDATGDLVDCSAILSGGQWRGLRIEQIAAQLATPFGVSVRADVDTGRALASFALQEGESVYDAIERAARIRALLVVSDGKGGLVLTRPGLSRVSTALVLGANALQVHVRSDWRDRHSSYALKGQAPGSDYFNGTAAAHVYAKVTDSEVPRYRPLVIVSDQPDIAATLHDRVRWEAKVRAARSLSVRVDVQGWRHAGGLWQPGALVRVLAPPLRLDDELLISSVEYSLDGDGSRSRLELTRADAFTLLPQHEAVLASGYWSLPRATGAR